MSGYLGTKAVLLSTTSATVGGDSTIGGDLTVDTNTLYVDSTNNNVGIGTSSPSSYNSNIDDLVVYNAASGGITIATGTSSQGAIAFADGTSGSSLVMGRIRYDHSNNSMGFRVNNDEKMSIDSSGNLLVGKTSTSFDTAGSGILSNGEGQFVRDGGHPVAINRKTSDGNLIYFAKDGTQVGSIGSEGGNSLYINSGDTGLRFSPASDAILPASNNGAARDNAIDLGTSGARFDDVYATNGTIQTSDRNEKQQIAALTDAEMTAAKAISKLFKTFKWNDSVAEKGDAARTHTGVIAQEVEAAMSDAGLNAGDYAFFISSDWTDEGTGEERNRKGIRYPQLMSFIGAATEQRLASIEARLDALEGN
jgi:hypothetical protein